MESTPQMKI